VPKEYLEVEPDLLLLQLLAQEMEISSGSEPDRDCDNRSSHIHDILKNLKEAAPATKRPEDSAIPHLSSIQETAQMQGKSHCRRSRNTIFIAKLD
jgi:hypothetical protein